MRLIGELWHAKSFSERLKIARIFAKDVASGFYEHRNETLAALMLAVLTLHFPPAQWFLELWAVSSVFSIAVHLLRSISLKAQRNSKFARWLLRGLNKPLAWFDYWVQRAHTLIEMIKDGIFRASTAAVDLVIKSFGLLARIVQPRIMKQIDRAKSAFQGFMSWVCKAPAPQVA